MPKERLVYLAFPIAAALLPVSAQAEDAGSDGSPDDIVVAALRTPVERDKVASSVTVLDEAEINAEQPIAVSDVLVRTPGISMTRTGGYGTATSLRIRGADTGQTALVIDGMRLADPSSTAGGYNFANLLADDVGRIEILRGPQSILWGSDAIGGVINIETVRPTKPLESSMAVELGSRQTVNARVGLGGHSDKLDWRVAGSAFNTQGISSRSNGTEPDGYTRKAGSGTLTYRFSDNISVDLRGYYANSRNEFDGTSGDSPVYGLNREWTVYAGFNVVLLDGRFRNRFAILQNETDRENFDPSRIHRQINFDAEGKTRRYEYQGSFAFSSAADLIFGAEREEQRMSNVSPADNLLPYTATQSSADINSLYSQLRITPLTGLTLNGGLRWDDHSIFGGNTVFSGGGAWSLNKGTTILRASYDEGFKAPSLYQLFSLYGSTDLQPERAHGWETGVEQSLFAQKLHLSATHFERNTDNLIDFVSCPVTGALPTQCYIPGTSTTRFGYYTNVKASQAHGLELVGAARLGRFFADANYSWISAEDRTAGPNFGNQLARVPRHLANGRIGYDFPFGLTTSVAVRYSGESFDKAQTSATVPSPVLDDYVLTDIRAEWTVAPQLTIYGRVENLFDEDYQTALGYSTLGRSVYLGIRGSF
jgi:vitamin B12 transporter